VACHICDSVSVVFYLLFSCPVRQPGRTKGVGGVAGKFGCSPMNLEQAESEPRFFF
jgi:hypothetical protein